MRVKKTRKTPRAARPARSVRTARSMRSKKAPAATTSNYAWITSSHAIVSAMIFVVVAAAFVTAREDMPRTAAEREEMAAAAVTFEPEASRPLIAMTMPSAKATTTPSAKLPAAEGAEPVAASMIQPVVRQPDPEPEPETETESVAAATITGCLERGEGGFRLSDASGAPMARSWKSGFLRKRPAPIEVADAVGTLSLRNHIGRRVSATGTLIDRELRARSVRVVGPCE